MIMLVFNEAICLILVGLMKSKDMNEDNKKALIIKKLKFIEIKRQF